MSNETLSRADVIKFYRVPDVYGCFSNFARYPICLEGKVWPTSEHYFQARKFLDMAYQEQIRQAKSAMLAAKMGNDRSKPIRDDWECVKVAVMREAVRAKFTQHSDILQVLLSTEEARIVEHTVNDAFWGDGGDGRGKNMLGRILMEIRDEIRRNG